MNKHHYIFTCELINSYNNSDSFQTEFLTELTIKRGLKFFLSNVTWAEIECWLKGLFILQQKLKSYISF